MAWMLFVTKLGDLSVLIPLALLLGVFLWKYETSKAAYAFVTLFIFCLATMLILKLFFLTCGTKVTSGIASPSGHTAGSTFVFGSIGIVFAMHAPRQSRLSVCVLSAVLIAFIAASRFYLGAHSILEIIIGLFVGGSYVLIFFLIYIKLPHPHINIGVLATGLAGLTLLVYGSQLPAELVIREWSRALRFQTGNCAVAETVDHLGQHSAALDSPKTTLAHYVLTRKKNRLGTKETH